MVVDRPPPLLNATRRPRDCEIEMGQKPYSLEAKESRENKEDERRHFSAAMRADQSSFSDLISALGITLIRIVNDPEVPRGGWRSRGKRGEGRGGRTTTKEREEKSRIEASTGWPGKWHPRVDREFAQLPRGGSSQAYTSRLSCLSGCTNRIQSTVQTTAKRFEL